MSTTLIRNADWVIAWSEAARSHRYLRRADLAFQDGRITFVGKGYQGPADAVIPGEGQVRDARAGQYPLPPLRRGDGQGLRRRGGRRAARRAELGQPDGGPQPRRSGPRGLRRVQLLRAAAQRGDHAGGHLLPLPGLVRAGRAQRAAALFRADVHLHRFLLAGEQDLPDRIQMARRRGAGKAGERLGADRHCARPPRRQAERAC